MKDKFKIGKKKIFINCRSHAALYLFIACLFMAILSIYSVLMLLLKNKNLPLNIFIITMGLIVFFIIFFQPFISSNKM